MLHTFKFDNKYLAYDVFSTSIMIIDEIAYEVLNLYTNYSCDEIHKKLDNRFNAIDINDTIKEVEQMKNSGVIFADLDYESIKQDYDPRIKALCLHIAHDCDLRCKYCFAGTGAFGGERSLMSSDTGKRALDFLFENCGTIHNLEVDFFGGEPMMNLDAVKDIVEYGHMLEKRHDKSINFTLTTNAYNISKEDMKYLNDEMFNIVISIDGRPRIHDFMRPNIKHEGSHKRTLENAKELVKLRGEKSHYIRGTFTRHNLDFKKDVEYLYNQGFRQISIEPVVCDERFCYSINDSHIDEIIDEYENLAVWYLKMREEGSRLNFFHFNIDLENAPCAKKCLNGCGAGVEYMAVTPEGHIYPCHQFTGNEEYKLGELGDESLNEKIRHKFADNLVSNKQVCSDCWAQLWCGGGCSANALAFNSDIAIPHEIGCKLQRKRLECALAIYAIETNEE